MNVHAVCNVENFCACRAHACFTRRQCCWLDDQGIIHQCQAGRSFLSSTKHPNKPLKPAPPPIQSVLSVSSWARKHTIYLSSARVNNMWNCMCCTSTPLYTLTVWCLMKHGDSFTLYGVCSCQ